MVTYFYKITINLLLLIIFMNGCASMDEDKRGAKNTEQEKIKNYSENRNKIDDIKVSEFILGVGDKIDITVYRHDDLKRSIIIDSSGRIMFPLIGDVHAAGVSIFILRDELQKRLSKYLVNPQVTINVTSIKSQKIVVLGEVNKPGIFSLDSEMSVLDAISKAGGITNDAKLSNVLLIRKRQGKAEAISLNIKKTLKEGDISQNKYLRSGDMLFVPEVTIANVSRFFTHLSKIISPFVSLGSGIVIWNDALDVLQGKEKIGTPIAIPAE